MADYSQAIRLSPKLAMAYHYRAHLYLRKSEYDSEIADLTESIKIKPDAEMHFSRGSAYNSKGDNNKAIADYTEAIRLDPKCEARCVAREYLLANP